MDVVSQRFSRPLWIWVGLLIVILGLVPVASKLESRRLARQTLPVLGQVADFTLTNQDGRPITLADLRGHVWVADMIFSRCPGPCPRMTRQMASLQEALPPTSRAKLVTLTTDPDYDTPRVLKSYPGRLGVNADASRWMFLTGAKGQIAALATGSLKLARVEIEPEDRQNPRDLFVHSTIFVVVDKQARLRGVFETGGEGVEWTSVKPGLLAAVAQLELE